MTMTVRFWGVRGSIASPGPSTQGVGGNTSSVELRLGSELFILDAGTGLRALGDTLVTSEVARVHLWLSHLHWDHIQGLPFFAPLYVGKTPLCIHGPATDRERLRRIFATQMTAPVFPVELHQVEQALTFDGLCATETRRVGDVHIRSFALNHPGGSLAYRFEWEDKVVVYATDHEARSDVQDELARFSEGANVLILDSQYLPEELDGSQKRDRRGFGHSSYEQGAAVARAAGVGAFVMFHHDPSRSDDAIADIERRARALFQGAVAAREGGRIELCHTPLAA